jgi:hypothetical protein
VVLQHQCTSTAVQQETEILCPELWVTNEGVSKSFRTGRLERELQMVQLSTTRCNCIVILWVSLVSSAAITLCVASQRVFVVVVVVVVVVDFVMDSSGTFWICLLHARPYLAS